MEIGSVFILAFALSLIWVGAMVDLHRREDLSDDHSTMWFSALLVGSLLTAIVYVVWRVVGLVSKKVRG